MLPQPPPDGSGFHGAYGFNGDILIAQNHGFRAFRFDADGDNLMSLVFDYEWQPGANRAVCATSNGFNKPARDCPFPHKGCSHGFYAYYGEDYFDSYFTDDECIVNGVVNGYGRCVIGDKGYRSEYANLVALARPLRIGDDFRRQLRMTEHEAEAYVCAALERKFPTVPIFPSMAELRKAIPLPGRPPRNDQ